MPDAPPTSSATPTPAPGQIDSQGQVTPQAPPKPGYKTTEFWLKLAAILLTALYASGVIPTAGVASQVTAIAATLLMALGYTVSRTLVKTAGALLLFVMLSQNAACSWLSHEGTIVKNAAVDCTSKEQSPLLQLGVSALEKIIQLATGSDGKTDWSQVDDGAKNVATDDAACVFTVVAQNALHPPPPKPGAPASSPLVVDTKDLVAHYELLRAKHWGGRTYHTSHGDL